MLADDFYHVGEQVADFDVSVLPNGIYLAFMSTGQQSPVVKRFMVIK